MTVGAETHRLPNPFFVLATQNPLENEGTYPLPEAQLDRFLLKINVSYPSRDELKEIVRRTTASHEATAEKTADAAALSAIQQGAKEILLAEEVLDYAVQLTMMTHPGEQGVPDSVKKICTVRLGPARSAVDHFRSQGEGADGRKAARIGERHPEGGSAGAPPSDLPEL